MADISAFTAIPNTLWAGNNIQDFTASGALKAGQVVSIDATGVSMTVRAAVAEAGEMPIGVAVNTVADGEKVAVATDGCICYVANFDDTTAIDAGSFLEVNDCAVGGTVGAVAVTATGGATVTVHNAVIGVALDDIAGGGTGRMLIRGLAVTQANSS